MRLDSLNRKAKQEFISFEVKASEYNGKLSALQTRIESVIIRNGSGQFVVNDRKKFDRYYNALLNLQDEISSFEFSLRIKKSFNTYIEETIKVYQSAQNDAALKSLVDPSLTPTFLNNLRARAIK
jgi:hypothetical protein